MTIENVIGELLLCNADKLLMFELVTAHETIHVGTKCTNQYFTIENMKVIKCCIKGLSFLRTSKLQWNKMHKVQDSTRKYMFYQVLNI